MDGSEQNGTHDETDETAKLKRKSTMQMTAEVISSSILLLLSIMEQSLKKAKVRLSLFYLPWDIS